MNYTQCAECAVTMVFSIMSSYSLTLRSTNGSYNNYTLIQPADTEQLQYPLFISLDTFMLYAVHRHNT